MLDLSYEETAFLKILTRRRPLPLKSLTWGVQNFTEIIKIKRRDVIFQNSDPPEAPAPEVPYLGSPKTNKNHQNRKRDVISQNPDPPEAPAPEKSYLENPKNHKSHQNEEGGRSQIIRSP